MEIGKKEGNSLLMNDMIKWFKNPHDTANL